VILYIKKASPDGDALLIKYVKRIYYFFKLFNAEDCCAASPWPKPSKGIIARVVNAF
jgi:hypothetical protein